jgi:ABC-type phosphate transport system substrate-binding protein
MEALMNWMLRFVMVSILLGSLSVTPRVSAQEEAQDVSVDESRALLESIDPYLPRAEVAGEVDVFGSTSMDAMAHGWAIGFKKFHPKVKIVISAEGSETVFARLAKNPASLGMVSRPVTQEDLAQLKEIGLKNPAALMVAREALGVFVHNDNPRSTYQRFAFFVLHLLPRAESVTYLQQAT